MTLQAPPIQVYRGTFDPIDHREGISCQDPLSQLAGLSLDFITKVVQAPMAMFLVLGSDGTYQLAEIKAEPILSADPKSLARDYLSAVVDDDPVLRLASTGGRAKILGTEILREQKSFTKSRLAKEFLAEYDLGPMVVLVMHDQALGQAFLTLLIRGAEEPEFSEREKGFLRQAAPFLTQSYHCAIGLGGTHGPQLTGNMLSLTPREIEIARLAATGARNQEIAQNLHISNGTVKCHIRNIYSKLGVDSRVHLALALGS